MHRTLRLSASVALILAAAATFARAQPGETDLRHRAIEQVLEASRSDDALLRTHATEAAAFLTDRALPLLQLALEDPAAPVRYAALVTIGRQKIASMAGSARRLMSDADGSVRAAAIFALHQNGQAVDISPLAQLLVDSDPAVRGNTVMLLGWMGEASAVPMLREMVQRPAGRATPTRDTLIRLQAAEAMARLGDAEAMVPIRAGAYSTTGEVRVLAVTIMGDVGDHTMQPAVAAMLDEPPIEQQIAAATALAKLGDGGGLNTLVQGSRHRDAMVRAQAAAGLGHLPQADSRAELARLLADEDAHVRLAAAAALLRQMSAAEAAAK